MTPLDWTLAALLAFAPPERHDGTRWADDSREAALVRYQGIASAIVAVCPEDDRSCHALLAAIAIGESGLARDADVGPCYREGGYRTRCDSGLAASVWQAHAFGADEAGEAITIARLFADRELAAWQTLRVARSSLARCGRGEDSLSGLSGTCKKGPGPWRARWRLWSRMRHWMPKEAR